MGRQLLSQVSSNISNRDISLAIGVLANGLRGSKRNEITKRINELGMSHKTNVCETSTQTTPLGKLKNYKKNVLFETENEHKLWLTGPGKCATCGRDVSCSSCTSNRQSSPTSVLLSKESLTTLEQGFLSRNILKSSIVRERIKLLFVRQLLKKHCFYYIREREERRRYAILQKQSELMEIMDLMKSRFPSPPATPIVINRVDVKTSFVKDMLTRHQRFLAPLQKTTECNTLKQKHNQIKSLPADSRSQLQPTLHNRIHQEALQTADTVSSW